MPDHPAGRLLLATAGCLKDPVTELRTLEFPSGRDTVRIEAEGMIGHDSADDDNPC